MTIIHDHLTFLEKAYLSHGNTYDYSESSFTRYNVKISIKCKKHGMFNQFPWDHLGGKGCPKCGSENTGKKKQLSESTFIERCNKIHNYEYGYSKSAYKGYSSRIVIECNIHGEFTQIAGDHIRGSKCSKCISDKKLSNKCSFIAKSKEIHGERFLYDNLPNKFYVKDKVTITCKIHGNFEQLAGHHLSGQGCFKCVSDNKRKSLDYHEDYASYISFVRTITEKNYKLYRDKINPLNLERGSGIGKYHVDHIYSKLEGFKNSIDPDVVGHWTNLQMLKHEDNSSKNDRCDKTIKQLYEDYRREK